MARRMATTCFATRPPTLTTGGPTDAGAGKDCDHASDPWLRPDWDRAASHHEPAVDPGTAVHRHRQSAVPLVRDHPPRVARHPPHVGVAGVRRAYVQLREAPARHLIRL